jgi:hypothetical protein
MAGDDPATLSLATICSTSVSYTRKRLLDYSDIAPPRNREFKSSSKTLVAARIMLVADDRLTSLD